MRSTRNSRRRTLRPAVVAMVVAVGLALLGGCGGQQPADLAGAGHTHVMPDGSVMPDSQMADMAGRSDTSGRSPMPSHAGGPGAGHAPAPGRVTHADEGASAAAAMICNLETAKAVRRALAQRKVPTAVDGWSDRTYRCDYQLPGGLLRLSVKDIHDRTAGRAWFDRLRAHTPGARTLKGVQALGFPAFEAPRGQVGFFKDGRTLLVDATNLPGSTLPPGFSRVGVAYAVAAAVMACWTE